jgi:hypothetical protein
MSAGTETGEGSESPGTYTARPGVHRKVLAVEAAVKEQARRLAANE